uniref:Uncharacterized protein n=1 Tax=Microcebus murinus TaxID=30608 RepID=A0A8C6EJC9_MICMU
VLLCSLGSPVCFCDPCPDEVADLFLATRRAGAVVEKYFQGPLSPSPCRGSWPEAGQTVK